MKLHFVGKYKNNPNTLPHNSHKNGAVKFKEPDSTKKLAITATGISVVILLVVLVITAIKIGDNFKFYNLYIAAVISTILLFVHELLHAICFKKDVYLYLNFAQCMLFVVGPEDMSKARFIIMSLLPNIVLGFMPFIICMFFPQFQVLFIASAVMISAGSGDYINVFNAATQMPKGSRTYLHKINSYWYMPNQN